jgi:hypothetical protein
MKFRKKIVGDVLKYRGFDTRKVRVEGDKIFIPTADGAAYVFYATGECLFNSDDANYLRERAAFKRRIQRGFHYAGV